jgi:hypothetical protein
MYVEQHNHVISLKAQVLSNEADLTTQNQTKVLRLNQKESKRGINSRNPILNRIEKGGIICVPALDMPRCPRSAMNAMQKRNALTKEKPSVKTREMLARSLTHATYTLPPSA